MVQDREISERIKQARIASGYRSARIFAKEFGIAESTYAQHESGKRTINLATLMDYCNILGTNPAWVITGREPMLTKQLANISQSHPSYMAVYAPILFLIIKNLLKDIPSYILEDEKHFNAIVTSIYKEIKRLEFDLSLLEQVTANIYREQRVNIPHTNIA
jgi:transcriptional regulator with XRE-family HTH domain